MSDSFREDWGYPSEVLKTIPGARSFDVNPLPETYRTGRPKFEAVFYSADRKKVLARRDAMELTSKKTGAPYKVCRRRDAEASRAAPAPSQTFGLDDVLA